MFEAPKPVKAHGIVSENRESARISGVSEVLSFDEDSVVCKTDLGVLAIKGSGLRVSSLNTDTGVLEITGQIDSFVYESGHGYKSKQSVLGRIFK
ncbi:MAG: sporulation protein YabP [Defluviitaleaceae bacterium]|nr:sporulation protein YabP [Defluviitaleaceae bacterium]MCL2835984.1 sporulation protein YabP [Defluviitaleaceae bacterium]